MGTWVHPRRFLTPCLPSLEGFRVYFTEIVDNVFSQKSIPAQTRQLVLYVSNDKGKVDGCVRKLTYA